MDIYFESLVSRGLSVIQDWDLNKVRFEVGLNCNPLLITASCDPP